jgi:hypothetical protein
VAEFGLMEHKCMLRMVTYLGTKRVSRETGLFVGKLGKSWENQEKLLPYV